MSVFIAHDYLTSGLYKPSFLGKVLCIERKSDLSFDSLEAGMNDKPVWESRARSSNLVVDQATLTFRKQGTASKFWVAVIGSMLPQQMDEFVQFRPHWICTAMVRQESIGYGRLRRGNSCEASSLVPRKFRLSNRVRNILLIRGHFH